MGERKVLNRYFPPDFDPLLVPKRKWDPYKQVEVRMMIPFSMQCNKCGEFMYRGKKFNSRKEDVIGDDYLGVRKYRFYIKCSLCNNEIAFKTDPQNNDYVCESGATRNFESWRQQTDAEQALENEQKEEAEGNAMAVLESRTLDSKMEMDILDALDEIKAVNERHAHVERDPSTILRRKRDDEVDEAAVEAFRKERLKTAASIRALPKRTIQSSSDDDDRQDKAMQADRTEPPLRFLKRKDNAENAELSIKRRLLDKPPKSESVPKPTPQPTSRGTDALGLLAYNSSSGSDNKP